MLKRLRGHLSPSMVVAIIALFAALGGGYAVAFSGSGSLQKAGELGIDGSAGATVTDEVRTLTGIGALGAGCDTSTGNNISIRFRNSSGETLEVGGNGVDGGAFEPDENPVDPDNVYVTIYDDTIGSDFLDLFITTANGTKSPQAHVQVGITEPGGGCTSAIVRVLALNTQE